MIHRMKFFLGLFWATTVLPLAAQVSVELAFNQHNYMQYEPIYAKVKLRNYSGTPLVFGKNDRLQGELLLEIEYNKRLIQPIDINNMSMIGTVLMPGQTEEFIIPVNRYYKLTKPGKYFVHAYVRHKMLKDMFRSRDCSFEIVKGVEIWHRTVGVPEVLKNTGKSVSNQSRNFSLRILEEKAVQYYYLVIDDAKKVYAVSRLGVKVNSENYSAEVDMLSRLHLIVPLASKLYRYTVINQDGKIEQQQMLKADKTKPRLVRNPDNGEVRSVGGTEALPGVDYKVPEKKEVSGND